MPKCPKCENTHFTAVKFKPANVTYYMFAICCSKCDTIVSTHEQYYISEEMFKQNKVINALAAKAGIAANLPVL